MHGLLRSFLEDESGATAIEYVIIAGFIGIALVGSAAALSTDIQELIGRIGTALNDAVE